MNNYPDRFSRVFSFLAAPMLGLTLFVSSACTVVHSDDPSTVESRIDAPPDAAYAAVVEEARAVVREFVVAENLPGLSIAVGVAGEVVWAEGFGWADFEQRAPVTPGVRFRTGSVAMPITATAVGLLYERGLLDLDAPVGEYLPELRAREWPVTTRQLMGHLAGVRRYSDDEEPLYQRQACATATEGLRLFIDDPLLFEPGTRYRYSPYGWVAVGAVVESIADEPFLAFLRREVLDPLGMSDTVLDDPERYASGLTSFYFPAVARDSSIGVHDANDGDQTCMQGAEALLSTSSDLVRFGLGILNASVVRAETLDLLRTPLEIGGESTGHGLGWFVREVAVGRASEPTLVLGHGGSSAGGTTSLVIVPAHELVIAIATNVSFARGVASDVELGSGLRRFFHDGSLARVLADIFVRAGSGLPRFFHGGPLARALADIFAGARPAVGGH